MRLHQFALPLVLLGTAGCATAPSPRTESVADHACSVRTPTDEGVAHGGPGNDVVLGLGGEVHGDEDDDRIYAGRGSVRAFGDAGRDLIDGGPAADDLEGGGGPDILIGELGADRFVYAKVLDSPAGADGRWSQAQGDTIVDFSPADGDRIDVSKMSMPGASGPQFRWSNRSPGPYGVWFGRRNGDTVVFVENTGDSQADLAIRLLGRPPMSSGAFCGLD